MVTRPAGVLPLQPTAQLSHPTTPVAGPSSTPQPASNDRSNSWGIGNPWEDGENEEDENQKSDSGSDWDEISEDEATESKNVSTQLPGLQNDMSTLKVAPTPTPSQDSLLPKPLQVGMPLSSPTDKPALQIPSPSKRSGTDEPIYNSSGVPTSPTKYKPSSNPYLRKKEEETMRRLSDKGGVSPNTLSIWDGGDLYPTRTSPVSPFSQKSPLPASSQLSNASASGQIVSQFTGDERRHLSASPSANAPQVVESPGQVNGEPKAEAFPFGTSTASANAPEVLQPGSTPSMRAPEVVKPGGSTSSAMAPEVFLGGSTSSARAPELLHTGTSTSSARAPEVVNAGTSTSSAQAPEVVRDQRRPSNPFLDPIEPSTGTSSSVSPAAGPSGAAADVQSTQTRVKTQRNEIYHIKLVRWHDASSLENPRSSPILIQNANGPCPLLALVNALVLSTPAKLTTALIETLRTREQVSLGFLLDAVFDELTSGRRGDGVQELPDVGELYRFLITLHTGMNVNPRFIPPRSDEPSLLDLEEYTEPSGLIAPGGFEQTREMRLYSTFSIPLLHGWMPVPSTAAYAAFKRCAQTYEDAQNIQFQEEELERKLRTQELGAAEQTLYIDLASIKQFFSSWPTQLTNYGLETLSRYLAPGAFAILFRNDHFSTIYKEPTTGRLMTLVTDAGYATHEEIVWESLVDINGSASEMYAGDFKSVSHNYSDTQPSVANNTPENEWTTVSRRPRPTTTTQQQESGTIAVAPADPPPPARDTLQEDHDLALALQLQEEEEDLSRRSALARRREDELSQQYLSSETAARRGPEDLRPSIPARRSGAVTAPSTAPVVRPADPAAASSDLPTYEQASATRPFVPPRGHPASEHAPLRADGGRASSGAAAAPAPSYAAPRQGRAGVAAANVAPRPVGAPQGRRRTSARQSLVEQSLEYQQAQMSQVPIFGYPGARRARDGNADGGDRDKCAVM